MDVKSPQKYYFKMANKYTKIYKTLFWAAFIFTVLFTFLNNNNIVNSISIFVMIMLFILEYITNYYIFKGEETRREDYFDNSFGTHYRNDSSENYYDTNELNKGLYKMIVNTFENSLFSMEISKRMEKRILKKNLILIASICGLAIYGFIQRNLVIPILQIFLSKSFIIELIDIHKYNARVEKAFRDLIDLFSYGLEDTTESINKYTAKIIKIYLEYESNISDLKIMLDSKIYSSINSELTEKWNTMKKTYNIK